MLRVLHVGKFYPPAAGGMERVVQMLCAAAPDRIESRVLAFNCHRRTVDEIVDGVCVKRVATWGAAGSVQLAPSLASHLRRADADVVVLHEPNPWALLSWTLARVRVPLVVWFHSEVVRPALQYRLFYAPLVRAVYGQARRFLVSSPPLARHARALRPYRDRITVIPFGIDATSAEDGERVRHRALEIRAQDERPRILFAGRLVAYKGVDVLIRAVAPLSVSLTVVGDGPMRQAWSAMAAREAGAARITFTGRVSDDELRAQLRACDLFVLPSVTRAEAFGVVQLEAMVRGKPVVSTALPSGVPWVNRDGETGLVVAPGDAAALGGAIARLLGDPSLLATLGAAARERVEREFTERAMGDRFVHVCLDAAESGT